VWLPKTYMNPRIPLAKPEVTDADREAVLGVLRTPYLSMGPKLQEFEQAICDYTGSRFAVAVNSGTSALQIAVRALRLEPGAEVILPSFAFSAVLNVVLQEKLRPVFIDVDPETYNTTPQLVAAAITDRTQLILAIHTFGIPAEVDKLRGRIAHGERRARSHSAALRAGPRHTIHLIEDACEALGAEVLGRKVGTFGDAGLFAFYPNKQITTGEGGMLVTADERIAAHARELRNQGRHSALDWYQHSEVGFSYRLSDINCALGVSQLVRIEAVVEKRQKLAEMYERQLAAIDEIVRPSLTSDVGRISWFVYPIRLAERFDAGDRDWICESMLRKGIATGRYFAPLHRQPVLNSHPFAKNAKGWGRRFETAATLPQTEFVADRVIALPFFNQLKETEIQEVCGALDDSIRELRRKT
jgi:perosamine synthetase